MARAAGLNTFADLERRTYLLRTPITDVMVVTYQGSCARSTIVTIMAVMTAPLGNSQDFLRKRRIRTSVRPAAMVELTSPTIAERVSCAGVATAIRINKMRITKPFGVLKKLWILCCMTQASGLVAFHILRHDEAFDAQAIQELQAFFRTKHKHRRR